MQYTHPLLIFILFIISLILFIYLLSFLFLAGQLLSALFYSKGRITVYLGANKEIPSLLKFRLGRIYVWVNYNPLKFRAGRVSSDLGVLTRTQRIIYTLSTPLTYLLMILFLWYRIKFYDDKNYVGLEWVLLVSIGLPLIRGLLPIGKATQMADGKVGYNYGFHLYRFIFTGKFDKMVRKARQYAESGNDEEAAKAFSGLSLYTNVGSGLHPLSCICEYLQKGIYSGTQRLSSPGGNLSPTKFP